MKWAEITKRLLPNIWPFYGGARRSIVWSQACAVFGGVCGAEVLLKEYRRELAERKVLLAKHQKAVEDLESDIAEFTPMTNEELRKVRSWLDRSKPTTRYTVDNVNVRRLIATIRDREARMQ